MKKMKTLFLKDPNDLSRVTDQIDPENMWVFDEDVKTTRKWDGTACAIIDGKLYKRYDAKKGKTPPEDSIPCQEPDLITGHWPHWVKCSRGNPADKYYWEAFDEFTGHIWTDGTYELCGPKINGNKDKLNRHVFIRHGHRLVELESISYEDVKKKLEESHWMEGIVFHHMDGRMCKIRRVDFGLNW